MKLNVSVFRTMILSALLFVGMAAEARVISGTVKDQTGETIISASVVVKGTSLGTVTDIQPVSAKLRSRCLRTRI